MIPRGVRRLRARTAPPEPTLACRAPFTSLHVDQFGDTRPCCQSSRVLGNVADQTLDEIWTGESLAELRTAIAEGDLSLGCEHCEWAGRGGRETTYAVRFDRDRLPEPDAGPTRLELAPSNACNLQCTMCNGDWSSSIRLHREKRPALPRLFGDRQLAEVAALADGLDEIHLFGGEPLLMPEGLRLLDIAADTGTRAVITTNGSVFTPRVEALLDRPGIDLVVSVDGTSPEVYESIRCGANWAALQEHLDRFQELAAAHGNRVDLAHCLMTSNWHEFPDHLRWAAGRGLGVYVNDVLSPIEVSLHHLSPPELDAVVRALRARQAEVDELPEPWRATWAGALERLEQTLRDGVDGGRHAHLGQLTASHADAAAPDASATLSPVAARLHARYLGPQTSVVLVLDDDLLVRTVRADGDLARFELGDLDRLVGQPSAAVRTLLDAPDRPDARTVLEWHRDLAVEERRYDLPAGTRSERRTIAPAGDHLELRFDYWLPPTDADEDAAIRSMAVDGAIVELVIEDGRVAAIGPDDLARDLGLRPEVGLECTMPTDIVVPALADPPPAFSAEEIEPGLVAVDLLWPDGHHLVVLARVSAERTFVRVGRAKPGPDEG
ncbi:MAG TPA: radical SAM protein [Acidimicrobiales bacterium]|nr:radical SAM protein [Acidimicrobiales bacterium]